VAALVAFIREVMSEQQAAAAGSEKKEERVEDMDLPF